ncbi:MAG TPA: hypothetical protein VEF76_01825 [Patescibacteria group bacterium]|nr:hypothetical protein [Patescibacteria group bacterium]
MGKLWHRQAGDDGKAQLQEIDLSTLKIDAPTVIYLSGFLTNNNQPGFISGGIKKTEELLAGAAAGKVLAWSHTSLANLFNLAAYNILPSSRASQAGYDLAAAVLMPLVARDFTRDAKGGVSGAPLPEAEARANLRNVTLFGYSGGSIVAQETFNATLKMMKKIGYEEKAARAVLKEVALISVGTISRPSKERDRFTTVYLVASNDRINRAKNWIWGTLGTTLRSLFRIARDANRKELTIRPLSDSSVFITTAVRPTLYEWEYGQNGEKLKKKWFQSLYPKWLGRRSYHELPHYVTTDENNNGFAKIVLHALTNAINRDAQVSPLALIAPPDDAAHHASYRERIENAVRPMPAAFQPRGR